MQPEALTTTRRRVGTSPGATAGGGRQRGSSAGDGMSPRQLATVALVFSYTAWFVLIATGVAAYEGASEERPLLAGGRALLAANTPLIGLHTTPPPPCRPLLIRRRARAR